ncbi:glycosyltransferase family 4 protein [Acaryochloris sp. IP29b_bin.148]|uniref:glycosyltransferase family 4 protein n=1 Tax=Acaryochloris sp. IP29b_bin.148 TaxID=2969218 RepID=UPI00262C8CC1|nr:glycosyltransferase family 4 protein [Acaryochloris sp. IP29b_bin.148]
MRASINAQHLAVKDSVKVLHILQIHNHYLARGGEDESFSAECQLLRQRGHQVGTYVENNKTISSLGLWKTGLNAIWSQPSYRAIRALLQQSTYDVVHTQNFFPLISPSVYFAARAEGVPVVQSLRNFRLSCPSGLFFRKGAVCEDCKGKIMPWPSILHRCYRNSWTATSAAALIIGVHNVLNTWQSMVDLYVVPTHFVREKFIQCGFLEDKIFVKPNFVYPDRSMGDGEGGYALFVGRLTPEKGIRTLLTAWESLHTKIPLKIVGEGPLAPLVQAASSKCHSVEWLGTKTLAEVYELMGRAMVLVMPSEWYETFGRVVIESFSKGTPVIASNIGAIAELVDSGRTGLHFQSGNHAELIHQVNWTVDHPLQRQRMRKAARAEFLTKYTAEENYKLLMEIYQLACTTVR